MASSILANVKALKPHRDQTKVDGRPFMVALREVTAVQWAQFWVSWLAWTCDAIDFFSVSLTLTPLAHQFGFVNANGTPNTGPITTAITLTLLFRSLGAVILGVLSDRFGRKWPLVINLLLVAVLELGSGFVQTFKEFLAVRSLFGIAMGGIWGLAASGGLENLPVELRGVASGVLQQGYAVGYLIAAVVNLRLVAEVPAGWRSLFWTASGISAFAAVLRILIPESAVFIRARQAAEAKGTLLTPSQKTRIFLHETKEMLKQHWRLCIYAVLLMTGFNFLSHGSQDIYPQFISEQKGLGSQLGTIATIIGNCGAIAGGGIAGWISQYIGRRLTIVIFVCLIGAFIPLWILPSTFSPLAAGAFCIQFGVQGAWGVIPIHLSELSPPAFRATFPGVAYQLGNMVSSASAQIEATGGANHKIYVNGELVNNYGFVQSILIGVVAAFIVIMAVFGPEVHASRFENAKAAFESGAGHDEFVASDEAINKEKDIEAAGSEKGGSSKDAGSIHHEDKIKET